MRHPACRARAVLLAAACMLTAGPISADPVIYLDLDRVVAQAVTRNPGYLDALAAIELAELDLAEANARFEPTVVSSMNTDARTGAEIGRDYRVTLLDRAPSGSQWSLGYHNSSFGENSLSELRLGYSLPFFKSPLETGRFALEQAELDLRYRERLTHQNAGRVILDAVTAYYQLSLAENRVALVRDQVNLAGRLHTATRLQARRGRASELDIRAAGLRLTQARQQLQRAEIERARVADRLKLLLDLNLSVDLSIDPGIPPGPGDLMLSDSVESFETAALANHAELVSLAEEIEIARRKLAEDAYTRYPGIDVQLQYSLVGDGDNFSDSFSMDDQRFGIGFYMDLDIGRSQERERKRLMLNYDARRRQHRQLEASIRASAREGFLRYQETASRLAIAREAAGLARDRYRREELRYKAGEVSTDDILAAEQALTEAQHEELEARVGHILAAYEVERAGGVLVARWQPRIAAVAAEARP